MRRFLSLLCQKQELQGIVDELDDWKGEGATIQVYGTTHKGHRGFVLILWSQPIPPRFISKLNNDHDMLDYYIYDDPSSLSPA